MSEYQAMMDVLRAGPENPELAAAPADPDERANHMKSFGYFQDASMIGICEIPAQGLLSVGSIKHHSEVQPGLTYRVLLANSPPNSR